MVYYWYLTIILHFIINYASHSKCISLKKHQNYYELSELHSNSIKLNPIFENVRNNNDDVNSHHLKIVQVSVGLSLLFLCLIFSFLYEGFMTFNIRVINSMNKSLKDKSLRFITGTTCVSSGGIVDPSLDICFKNCVKVFRVVKIYLFVEEKGLNEGEFVVRKKWVSAPIDSRNFHLKETSKGEVICNNYSKWVAVGGSKEFTNYDMRLENLEYDLYLPRRFGNLMKQVRRVTSLPEISLKTSERIKRRLGQDLRRDTSGEYYTTEKEKSSKEEEGNDEPEIGDIRLMYYDHPCTDVSILAETIEFGDTTTPGVNNKKQLLRIMPHKLVGDAGSPFCFFKKLLMEIEFFSQDKIESPIEFLKLNLESLSLSTAV